jgi:subtilisin
MAQAKRRSVIITFKPKEQRPAKGKDKLEVVSAALAIQPTFFNARTLVRGAAAGLPEDMIGYDVNQYEAPMVMASLTDAEIDALRKNGNVAAVEEDAPCYALGDLLIEGQPSPLAETVPAGVAQIKAPAAWDCSRGKAIKVAVVDTGIDGTHPDLAANYKGGSSFVPTESTPMDFNSHGTHCAGTIGAAINGAGVVGVAPAAYLYAVKVLDKTGSGQFTF